jgi:hypothetical protein
MHSFSRRRRPRVLPSSPPRFPCIRAAAFSSWTSTAGSSCLHRRLPGKIRSLMPRFSQRRRPWVLPSLRPCFPMDPCRRPFLVDLRRRAEMGSKPRARPISPSTPTLAAPQPPHHRTWLPIPDATPGPRSRRQRSLPPCRRNSRLACRSTLLELPVLGATEFRVG